MPRGKLRVILFSLFINSILSVNPCVWGRDPADWTIDAIVAWLESNNLATFQVRMQVDRFDGMKLLSTSGKDMQVGQQDARALNKYPVADPAS